MTGKILENNNLSRHQIQDQGPTLYMQDMLFQALNEQGARTCKTVADFRKDQTIICCAVLLKTLHSRLHSYFANNCKKKKFDFFRGHQMQDKGPTEARGRCHKEIGLVLTWD